MAARGLACAMASMSLRTPQHAQARSGLQHAEQSYAAPTSHKWQCAALSARRSSVCAGQALQSRNASAQAGRIEVCAVECKLKTRKAAAKRYKITGSGKVFTRRPGKQHINEKKSPKRLRALGKEKEIDHGDKRKVVRCLPYAKIK